MCAGILKGHGDIHGDQRLILNDQDAEALEMGA
jgi:hypothetical protein